ncbi:MAG: hypothetical protein JXQ27_04275 [Acidobacteria bacterium]|nr:hypothetical protein [Acidobacteriota bacterium]
MNKRTTGHKEMKFSLKLLIMGLYIAGSLLLFYHLARTDVTPTALAENSNPPSGPVAAAVCPSPGSPLPSLTRPVSPIYPAWFFTPTAHASPDGGPLTCGAGALDPEESAPHNPADEVERSSDRSGASRIGSSGKSPSDTFPDRTGCRDLPFPLPIRIPSPTRLVLPFPR